MVKFFTQEMSSQAEKMIKTDPKIQTRLEGVTLKFILLVTDGPGDEDREMKLGFKDGALVENALTIKKSPSDLRITSLDKKYAVKFVGPYNTMVQVSTKKLPMLSAIGSMRIEGDMKEVLTNMTIMLVLLDIFGSVPNLEL